MAEMLFPQFSGDATNGTMREATGQVIEKPVRRIARIIGPDK